MNFLSLAGYNLLVHFHSFSMRKWHLKIFGMPFFAEIWCSLKSMLSCGLSEQ